MDEPSAQRLQQRENKERYRGRTIIRCGTSYFLEISQTLTSRGLFDLFPVVRKIPIYVAAGLLPAFRSVWEPPRGRRAFDFLHKHRPISVTSAGRKMAFVATPGEFKTQITHFTLSQSQKVQSLIESRPMKWCWSFMRTRATSTLSSVLFNTSFLLCCIFIFFIE